MHVFLLFTNRFSFHLSGQLTVALAGIEETDSHGDRGYGIHPVALVTWYLIPVWHV